MTKTPEELAQEYVIGEFPDTNSDMFLAAESVHKAFIAGYKAAQDHEATKDQKIADLWAESIRRMLPSMHEITLFPSKQSEDK